MSAAQQSRNSFETGEPTAGSRHLVFGWFFFHLTVVKRTIRFCFLPTPSPTALGLCTYLVCSARIIQLTWNAAVNSATISHDNATKTSARGTLGSGYPWSVMESLA
jgi:hypothetical protein